MPLEWNKGSKSWVETVVAGNKEHPLRDPIGLPVEIFGEPGKLFDGRYTVENAIATMKVTGARDFELNWLVVKEDRLETALAVAPYTPTH